MEQLQDSGEGAKWSIGDMGEVLQADRRTIRRWGDILLQIPQVAFLPQRLHFPTDVSVCRSSWVGAQKGRGTQSWGI